MLGKVIGWIIFGIFIVVMLILDLGVFHRKAHEVKTKEALKWCIFWIFLAFLFSVVVYLRYGLEKTIVFLTCYLVEESLSVDNLFVFIMIFSYFCVPAIYQHRILFWGIIGAIVMRAIFIITGIVLINKFHWVMYIFGAFLIITAIKMLYQKDKDISLEKNFVLKIFRHFIPTTNSFTSGKFLVREQGKILATPLLVTLLAIETTDVIFAVDSVPAVLGITTDPFIVYTSNIFAILGLRSIYFLLARLVHLFKYLRYAVSIVLVFVGIKMLLTDFYKIPVGIALGVVIGVVSLSIIASIISSE